MGEKGSDAGQFFTPREVLRAMVRVLDPKVGERVFDPCPGTSGFLAQAAIHMLAKINEGKDLPTGVSEAAAKEIIKFQTFYGREKENLIYPIGLTNLILHGIDDPHIRHGNALTGNEVYGGLFKDAPSAYEVILTNPPFGGKENTKLITNFDEFTSATEVLFLQYNIRSLGAGVKNNLLFFTRGKPTEKIWYYDLSERKVGKKNPLVLDVFKEFFALLPGRADSDRSWTVDFTARRRNADDDARPFRKTEAEKKAEADALQTALNALKKTSLIDETRIAESEAVLYNASKMGETAPRGRPAKLRAGERR